MIFNNFQINSLLLNFYRFLFLLQQKKVFPQLPTQSQRRREVKSSSKKNFIHLNTADPSCFCTHSILMTPSNTKLRCKFRVAFQAKGKKIPNYKKEIWRRRIEWKSVTKWDGDEEGFLSEKNCLWSDFFL